MMGDLNARTATVNDFIVNDTDEFIDTDPDYLIDKQIEERMSQDNIINSRGRQLIDTCVQSRLRILNGGCVGDSGGYFTCHKSNGSSVVDYMIVNEELLDRVLYFKVHMLTGTLSDHCMISLLLKTNFTPLNIVDNPCVTPPDYYIWKDGDILKELPGGTGRTRHTEHNNSFMCLDIEPTKTAINNAVTQFQSILITTANKSLRRKRSLGKKTPRNKPWFDGSLISLKKQVDKKAQLLSYYPFNPVVRNSYYRLRKIYNKTRKYKERAHKQDIINKLVAMKTERPSEFWKLLEL